MPPVNDKRDNQHSENEFSTPALAEAANSINKPPNELAGLDPRIYEASLIARYLSYAELLRNTPGGRDPIATEKVETITADAYYAMAKRHASDIENQQVFRQSAPAAELPVSPTLGGLESMLAMSTKLFEEQVAAAAPHTLPDSLPEQGAIAPPIEVKPMLDVCQARELYEQAWQQKKLDDRQTLLEQSYRLSSDTDIDLDTRPELRRARVINLFFNALVEHDLTALDNESNRFRNPVTKDAVLSLWNAEELADGLEDLAPYVEKIKHFRRVYSQEIGIDQEKRPTITPYGTVVKIGNIATDKSLMIA